MSSHPRIDAPKEALPWAAVVALAILPFPRW
jgi:hypothetical protein